MDKNLYLIKQFESLLIRNGSKKLSKNFISFFFNKVRQKNEKPLDLLSKSISNVKPSFLIKVRKKGKRVVHVPKPII
jgi:ribosomal protein S7